MVSSSSRSKVYEKMSENPNYKLVNDYIIQKSNECETISLDEYIETTNQLGITETEARDLLQTFSIGGQVTYFHSSPELENTIFLRPIHLISQVEKVLKVNYLRRPLAEKIRRLQNLKGELHLMEEKKEILEAQAQKTVKVAAWSLFGFLSLQSLLFARLVWWDFDWGIMEPVTWFTSVCEMTIGGYIYYLFVRQEYGNTSIAGMVSKRRFESLCSKTSLDLVAMENLKNRITQIEADVMSETAKDKAL
uniref:Calcium uniporter protein n=1 Tax=Arcella intermedia TaxID=1963864 RepID=A0A6B2LFS2_9EUKA